LTQVYQFNLNILTLFNHYVWSGWRTKIWHRAEGSELSLVTFKFNLYDMEAFWPVGETGEQ